MLGLPAQVRMELRYYTDSGQMKTANFSSLLATKLPLLKDAL